MYGGAWKGYPGPEPDVSRLGWTADAAGWSGARQLLAGLRWPDCAATQPTTLRSWTLCLRPELDPNSHLDRGPVRASSPRIRVKKMRSLKRMVSDPDATLVAPSLHLRDLLENNWNCSVLSRVDLFAANDLVRLAPRATPWHPSGPVNRSPR